MCSLSHEKKKELDEEQIQAHWRKNFIEVIVFLEGCEPLTGFKQKTKTRLKVIHFLIDLMIYPPGTEQVYMVGVVTKQKKQISFLLLALID